MYLGVMLLFLAFISELQVADSKCEITECVDNPDCGIEFLPCSDHLVSGKNKTGEYERDDTPLECGETNVFKMSKCEWYGKDEDTEFITLTEIDIPKGVVVKIGRLNCNGKCKVLKLTPAAVPPIPHLKPLSDRFKISASLPIATIKFTCERECWMPKKKSLMMMKRIAQGEEVKPKNKYPFMAHLIRFYSQKLDCNKKNSVNITEIRDQCGENYRYLCGGSIIQNKWILTAQHCTEKTKVELSKLFKEFDTNNDNELTLAEFHQLMKKFRENISEEDARIVFEKYTSTSTMNIDQLEKFYDAQEKEDIQLYNEIKAYSLFHLVGIIVTVGDHNINPGDPGEESFWVPPANIERIDGYDADTLNKDVALLELLKEIDFTKKDLYYPICLPPYYWGEEEALKDCPVTSAGWGETELAKNDPKNDLLMEGHFKIITQDTCQKPWGTPITDYMICTIDDITNTCSGDSGGPVFCEADDGYGYEVGVVSFGYEDPKTGKWKDNFPEVHARVTKFLKWIAGIVKHLP